MSFLAKLSARWPEPQGQSFLILFPTKWRGQFARLLTIPRAPQFGGPGYNQTLILVNDPLLKVQLPSAEAPLLWGTPFKKPSSVSKMISHSLSLSSMTL